MMNKNIGILIVFILLFATALFVLAESIQSGGQVCLQTPVILDFEDAAGVGQWEFGKGSYNFDDKISGIKAVSGGPSALAVPAEKKKTCLGAKIAFKTMGYNFIELLPPVYKPELYPNLKDLFPSEVPNPYNEKFVPLPGKVKSILVWVAGRNYKYTFEVWLKDYKGFIYAMEMGSLDYPGWRTLSKEIPSYIPAEDKHLPLERPLKIVKFILRADPYERVDKFYVYIDQLMLFTDVYIKLYDGYDIKDTW